MLTSQRQSLLTGQGNIAVSRSQRFDWQEKKGVDFMMDPQSEFDRRRNGYSFSRGDRMARPENGVPGVGDYRIPTLWDKYRN